MTWENKKKRGRAAPVLLALCMLFSLTACQVGSHDIIVSGALGNRNLFQIENVNCSLKEAMVYLANDQNIYGTSYSILLWDHDFGEDSLENYVKDIALKELTEVYCMDLLAQSYEIALDEEELATVAAVAKDYYASLTSDEISYIGATENDMTEFYQHYALAQKIYNFLTADVNDEVSDDEARVMEIMQIFVTNEERAKAVQMRLSQGEDFAAVANNYNELEAIQTTITRADIPDDVEEVVFAMDDDEISDMLTAENGYYFIKCLNKYDEELTEANKSNIVEQREKEAFDDVYNDYISFLDATLNEDVWENLSLKTDGSIMTESFFSVYENYFGVGTGL